jgi:hypothetical protein
METGRGNRSRSDMALDVLALRQQVAVLKRKRPPPVNPRPTLPDDPSKLLAAVERRPGHRETRDRCRLAPRRPASISPGAGVPGQGAVDRRPTRRCERSSVAWRQRTPAGDSPGSTANCRSSASWSPNEPWPATCAGLVAVATLSGALDCLAALPLIHRPRSLLPDLRGEWKLRCQQVLSGTCGRLGAS